MIILATLIVLFIVFYAFFKIKSLRIKSKPYRKRWTNAKGSIALGAAMFFFGLNELLMQRATAIVIISVIFVVIGGYFVFQSIRAYLFYAPRASKEAQQQQNK